MKSAVRLSLLLLIAFGQAACAVRGAGAGARPIHLDDSSITALAELLRMEDARVLDTLLIGRMLAHPVSEVRARAALATGRAGDHDGTPLLLRALQDSDPGVRTRAAFALGELADTSAPVIPALGDRALGDQPAPAREAAAALGRLGVESGRPYLDTLLGGARVPPEVRQEALLVVWRLPRDTATLRRTAGWLTAADPETRWRAAYALSRGGGAAGVRPLLAAVDDPDPRVRANAVRGLRAQLADSAGARDRALAALLAAAADSHPHVRINAARLLPSHRAGEASTRVLVRLLSDTDANVIIAASQALAELGDRAAVGALRALAENAGQPLGVRAAGLAAWTRLDPRGAATLAAGWADSTRWLVRYNAARALGGGASPAAVALLQRLARDDHRLVTAAALDALRDGAASEPRARAVFIEALASADPVIRAAALRGIGAAPTPADLDLLLTAYDRATRDTVRDAAAAAVEALTSLARAGVPVERSFFLRFGEHGPPAHAAVHRAIVAGIGAPPAAWGEPAGAPEPRALAFYEDIIGRYVAPVLAGGAPPAVVITTSAGEIELELAADHAPLTVHNFLALVDRGYYEGTRWHRVVPNFVIQDGDPRGDGSGGPGYAIRDEINPLRYERGTLGMALSGPDTGGSQYFITHSPQPHLDGGYTVFGRVRSGMDVVDRVVQDDPILAIRSIR